MVDSEPVQQITYKGKLKVFYEGFSYIMCLLHVEQAP